MKFSTWSVKNPVPVYMLFILLMVSGLFAFDGLKVTDYPDLEYPQVNISITVPGETPEQLEAQITRKVENSVANVNGIKHIRSTITDGSSETSLEFDLDKNIQDALTEVKDAVSKIRDEFPPGTNEPQIYKVSIVSTPVLSYKISASMDISDLSWFVDNDVHSYLSSLPGIGKITRQGGVEREIQVLLLPEKLHSLAINDISDQLYNVSQNFSGGRIIIGGMEQSIEAKHRVNNVYDIMNLDIPLANASYVKLKDVASVRDTYAEIRQMSFLNAESIVSFDVFPAKGADKIQLGNAVRKSITKFNQTHPYVEIKEISNNMDALQETYTGSMHTLYEGAFLAILVVFAFLRDWRATFVAATALPLSILPTFLAMYWFDFSLNTVTMLALTLVIGVLVDDAIVEVENIVRHLNNSSSPIKAAIDAANEIGIVVIATSLTLVAVFLPTAFMSGIPGRIFKQFGWTASIAVIASLVVARLFTPMLAAYMLKPQAHANLQSNLIQRYLVWVKWCLANRGKVIGIAVSFFVLSMLLVSLLPTTFFPAQDNNQVGVHVQLQPGSTIQDTAKVIIQASELKKDIKGIASIYAKIGNGIQSGSSNTDNDVASADITYNLSSVSQRKASETELQGQILNRLKSTIPGVQFSLIGGGNGETYSLILAGSNSSMLSLVATKIETAIRNIPGLGNISSSNNLTKPLLSIVVDYSRAAELGVTTKAIGDVVRVATSGDYNNKLAKLNLPDRQIPIRVELGDKYSHSLEDLGNLRVSGNKEQVPLVNLASFAFTSGPAKIKHFDQSRVVQFDIDLDGHSIEEVNKKIQGVPLMQHLPGGIHQVASGDIEYMQQMIKQFLLAMAIGIFCMFCVLVLLFKSFKQPLTILTALPLAISGALGSLVLFHFSLSMASLIGILMLMGIVSKNSILLVDYAINAQRKSAIERSQAVIEACEKRVRPIVMTTLAMILGMLPIAVGISGNSGFRSPMAVAVIGGLITSTILSLFVIPVVFELVDDFKLERLLNKIKSLFPSAK